MYCTINFICQVFSFSICKYFSGAIFMRGYKFLSDTFEGLFRAAKAPTDPPWRGREGWSDRALQIVAEATQ